MVKKLREYIKYTTKELESYTTTEGSCVRKVNAEMHLSLWPSCMIDFKEALVAHIRHRKLGNYDAHLDGIVLDIKNIQVLGTLAAMRSDDPHIHVHIRADCYVFRPVVGAVLSGVVKHIGNHHIGVIIYRVFNASIRFAAKVNREEVKMNDTVQFRIKNFNLQNVFPYIDGDLVSPTAEGVAISHKLVETKADVNESTVDSGIEERETHELDELVKVIKAEQMSEAEDMPEKPIKVKKESSGRKRKQKSSDVSEEPAPKIKSEAEDIPEKPIKVKKESSGRKRKQKSSDVSEEPAPKIKSETEKQPKKRKSKSSTETLEKSKS